MKKIHTLTTIIFFLGIGFSQGPSSALFQQDKGHDKKGKWIRDHYRYSVGDIERLEVEIDYSIGELTLDANSKPKTISGDIFYYPRIVDPEIEYVERRGRGVLSVKIDHDYKYDWNFGGNKRRIENNFKNKNSLNFSIPVEIPIELDIDFGIGEANIDFTDLPLSRVLIDCGLGEMNIQMLKPNATSCDFLKIDIGLGAFNAEGLGNLKAREVDIEVGMGSADIDFRGHFTNDVEIDIGVGFGSLDLILPENVNVRAKVHHNFLSSVDLDDFIKKGNHYLTEDWNSDWPTVYLDISVGLGSVNIKRR
ncbi:hypothetical protein JYT44_02355 [Caldithrix abyssi]|nr:hypothetical protein [Caldithrix abyssi]